MRDIFWMIIVKKPFVVIPLVLIMSGFYFVAQTEMPFLGLFFVMSILALYWKFVMYYYLLSGEKDKKILNVPLNMYQKVVKGMLTFETLFIGGVFIASFFVKSRNHFELATYSFVMYFIYSIVSCLWFSSRLKLDFIEKNANLPIQNMNEIYVELRQYFLKRLSR